MVELVAVGIFLLIVSILSVWSARSAFQHRLITKHRDYLKSVNVRGGERLDPILGVQRYENLSFTIEVDGKIRRFRDLYHDKELISRLDDPELLRLSAIYKRRQYWAGGAAALLLVAVIGLEAGVK